MRGQGYGLADLDIMGILAMLMKQMPGSMRLRTS